MHEFWTEKIKKKERRKEKKRTKAIKGKSHNEESFITSSLLPSPVQAFAHTTEARHKKKAGRKASSVSSKKEETRATLLQRTSPYPGGL